LLARVHVPVCRSQSSDHGFQNSRNP
jgi:hypothetical protein